MKVLLLRRACLKDTRSRSAHAVAPRHAGKPLA